MLKKHQIETEKSDTWTVDYRSTPNCDNRPTRTRCDRATEMDASKQVSQSLIPPPVSVIQISNRDQFHSSGRKFPDLTQLLGLSHTPKTLMVPNRFVGTGRGGPVLGILSPNSVAIIKQFRSTNICEFTPSIHAYYDKKCTWLKKKLFKPK